MISRGVPDIHPDSSKWYWLEWSAAELGDSVTIDTVAWTVPAGLQQDATSQSGLTVGVRLSVDGGSTGSYYNVTCQIGTSNSETLNETLRIRIGTDGH